MKNMQKPMQPSLTQVLSQQPATKMDASHSREAEPPPGTTVPEAPETAQGPEVQKKDTEVQKNMKLKRKKTAQPDAEQVLAEVRGHLHAIGTASPPLLHTPYTMFEMLCTSFEQEFPDKMSQDLKRQVLLSLKTNTYQEVRESSVLASAAT